MTTAKDTVTFPKTCTVVASELQIQEIILSGTEYKTRTENYYYLERKGGNKNTPVCPSVCHFAVCLSV